jgi:hypothetical protein
LLEPIGVLGHERDHPHAGQALVSLDVSAPKPETDHGCA